MRTLLLVTAAEWRQLGRSRLGVSLLVLLVVSGAYGIGYGIAQMASQNAVIDARLADEAERLAAIRAGAPKVRYAMDVDADVARVAFDRPGPLAALAIGQRDVLPFHRTVSGRSLAFDGSQVHFDGMADEIANPQKLMAGNFDLAFVLVYLCPLALIALTFDALSEDRESGAAALWLTGVTAPTAVVRAKVLARAAPVIGTAIGLVLAGAFIAGSRLEQAGATLVFALAAALYLALWTVVALVVVAGDRSSSANGLVLIGVYLLLVFVAPSALGLALDVANPPRSRIGAATTIRDRNDALWGQMDAPAWDRFFAACPELPRDHPVNLLPAAGDALGFGKKVTVWHFLMDETARPALDDYLAEIEARHRAILAWHIVSPAVLVSDLLAAIARTDVSAHLEFQRGVREFQRENAERLRRLMFPGVPLADAALTLYGAYRAPPSAAIAARPGLAAGFATLLALVIAVGAAGWVRLNRTLGRPQ